MPDNKQIIQDFQRTLERRLRGEAADIAPFFSEDIAWHFPQSTASQASGSDHYGKTAVLAMFNTDVDQFYVPDTIQFDYHAFTAEDDRVHMHYTLSAQTTSGKPYRNHYQSLFRLQDGKIAEVWEYFDTAYLYNLYG